MIKAEFNVPRPTEEEETRTRQLIAQLEGNEDIQQLLRQQNIPAELLKQRPYVLSSWLKKRLHCHGCKGLNTCFFARRGFRDGLRYDDGLLLEVVEACPYEEERRSAQAHLSNYLVSDLGEEFSTVSFESISLDEEPDAYVAAVQKVWGLCGLPENYEKQSCRYRHSDRSNQKE